MRMWMGLGMVLGALMALQGPAWGALGMKSAELDRHYVWESGPEGTRLYQLGDAIFSPFLARDRMVGAIAELPPGTTPAGIKALLAKMTGNLRHQPAFERGTISDSSWELATPDYKAMAMTEGDKVFVLVQQIEAYPSPEVGGVVEDPVYRAENDLEILRAALESYRAHHWFRYPEVKTYDELIQALNRADVLPDGFRLNAPLTEFGVWKTGYQITVRAGGRPMTIRQPERWDPFWVFWQIRPFP